jgi:hypothetical protein
MSDRKTSAKPIVVDGVTFECWHTGIMQYVWRSQDGHANVYRPSHRASHTAVVDSEKIGRLYRSQSGAMKAAVAAMKKHAERVNS